MKKTVIKMALGAAIVSTSLLGSVSAQAGTYTLDLNAAASDDGYNTTEYVPVGKFTDTYSFTLTTSSVLDAALTNDFLSVKGKVKDNIQNLSLQLVNGPTSSTPTVLDDGSLEFSNLKLNTLYQLIVSGVGNGINGGQYSLNASVSPVPLPAALPLFAAAILGVGFARRRKATSA